MSYDREHWEALLEIVIERLGVDEFIDHVVYALERQGQDQLAYDIKQSAARRVQRLAEDAQHG